MLVKEFSINITDPERIRSIKDFFIYLYYKEVTSIDITAKIYAPSLRNVKYYLGKNVHGADVIKNQYMQTPYLHYTLFKFTGRTAGSASKRKEQYVIFNILGKENLDKPFCKIVGKHFDSYSNACLGKMTQNYYYTEFIEENKLTINDYINEYWFTHRYAVKLDCNIVLEYNEDINKFFQKIYEES
jgi:hypothetical protein